MKKLIIFLLLLSNSTVFGWTFKFTNESKVKARVTVDCTATKFTKDIPAKSTATLDTVGYCLNSITVEALENMKLIDGTMGKPRKLFWKANCNLFSRGIKEATPLNCCANQDITIFTQDFYGIEKQPFTAFNMWVTVTRLSGPTNQYIRISEY